MRCFSNSCRLTVLISAIAVLAVTPRASAQTVGACCRLHFCEENIAVENCPAGSFLGPGSSCLDCRGACCLPDNTCLDDQTIEVCESSLGGFFMGTPTTCPPDGSCSPRACCAPQSSCIGEVPAPACQSSGGIPQAAGTTCGTTSCDQSGGGACCTPLSTLGCLFTTEFFCRHQFDGTYLGDAIPCPAAGETCLPPTDCFGLSDGTPCDDGDRCTEDDACLIDACVGTAKDCTHLDDQCVEGRCAADTGICFPDPRPDSTPCDDPRPCTSMGSCAFGNCVAAPKDCSALDDQCNLGVCDPATDACITIPQREGQSCEDNNLCNSGNTCVAGSCVVGTTNDCIPFFDQCNIGVCNPNTGECSQVPREDGRSCDTGNLCKLIEICKAGSCVGSVFKDCSILFGTCTDGVCDPDTGNCKEVPRREGLACGDLNDCTTGDTCIAGNCVGELTTDCSDFTDQCNDGKCNPETGECGKDPQREGQPCEDDDRCTSGNTCLEGICLTGMNKDCSAFADQCNRGECNPDIGNCFQVPDRHGAACDDDDACTSGETCSEGNCAGGVQRDCSGFTDQCNDGRCDPISGACIRVPKPDGESCDDGDSCTEGDTCTGGTCGGSSMECGPDEVCVEGSCAPFEPIPFPFVDIKPGSCKNPFNRRSHGKIPVVLVGDSDFDPCQADLSSFCLSGVDGGACVPPARAPKIEDEVTAGAPCDAESTDDGFDDIQFEFDARRLMIDLSLDQLPQGESVLLVLHGSLLNGISIDTIDYMWLEAPQCDAFNCERRFNGGCEGCPDGLVCVNSREEANQSSTLASETQADTEGMPECRTECTKETQDFDCFPQGKCELCGDDGYCFNKCGGLCKDKPTPCTGCNEQGACISCCSEEQKCVGDTCRPKCESINDCSRVGCNTCKDGACVSRCARGEVCIHGECLQPCRGPAECGDCESCSDRFCKKCDSDDCDVCPQCTRCPANQTCDDGTCIDVGEG